MTGRPATARSEISSAISDDAVSSRPESAAVNQPTSVSTTPVTTQGYAHIRATPTPSTRRSLISPPPLSTNSSSRPTSPTSQTSRTHIPSITAQGFLRPLSSRRLQAQRLGRNSALGRSVYTQPSTEEGDDHTDDARSVGSSRQGPYAPMPKGHKATPSVTSYADSRTTDRFDNSRRDQAPDVYTQFPYMPTEPVRISQPPTPPRLNQSLHVGSIREDILSPRSLRSGLTSLGSRNVLEPGQQYLNAPGSNLADNKLYSGAQKKKVGKNYEYFEGNTMFWWGGRLQNSRDRPINLATCVVIVVPMVLFFVFSASYLWHHVSPALPIVFAYLYFVCFSSFLHASLIDPGIFPRNIHPFPPDSEDPLALGPPTNDWVMVKLADSDNSAMDVPIKYCKTCNIWRPPRCYHCRVCDNCVETLDHHCVWLNNCVGRRNYRYFFTFISSGSILALYLAFASLGHIFAYKTQERVTLSHSINVNRVPMAMFVYGILALSYPLPLCFYHLFLTGRGETTRESLAARRFPKEDRHRPFNLGNVFANWTAVFGRPKPPTYLHFKKAYEEGDQRFGSRRGDRQAPLVSEAQGGGMEMKRMPGSEKAFEGPQSRPGR